MKLKTTDMEKISKRKCQVKNCKNKSYAIAGSKYLCEFHYRLIVPKKNFNYLKYGRMYQIKPLN